MNVFNHRELSKAEIIVAHSLRGLFKQTAVGASFEETEDYRLLMVSFDYFIPEVLGELYPEWKSDALDDLIPLVAKRSGEREAILFGLSWLIRDQTVVPTYLQLQIDPVLDRVNWLECRIGERGPQGMIRRPGNSFDRQLYRLQGREDQIDWAYHVTFGEKSS
ncbi:hypothetical protein [Gimesia maris]|uniref:hypothetical protein n=1 Tax=Gimesia maris TaxID=122 RepID=UPI0032ECD2E3